MIQTIINEQRRFIGKGCLPDLEDKHDYKAEEILGAIKVERPSFIEGYSVKAKYWSDMSYKNQDKSFGCVQNSWAYYKQLLDKKETGESVELSAKSLGATLMPGKGSYIRDTGMFTIKRGVNRELRVPSNRADGSCDDAFIKDFVDTIDLQIEAGIYKNRTIATVSTMDFDKLADMMFLNDGIISGWNNHAVWFESYGIKDGHRYIHTPNSYGPYSDLYYFEGMTDLLYSAWTAIDQKNMPEARKLRLVRGVGEKNVYFILNGKRYLVLNPSMMTDGLVEGMWGGFGEVEELHLLDLQSFPLVRIPWSDIVKQWLAKK